MLGEAEELMPQVIEDMRRGTLRHTYAASSRPDITRVPSPRWDLIDLRNYVTMSVQFSRGCPFDCEFCDIIVMNGRVPRTKSPAQLVAELEELRRRGWQGMVFVVDDNFIGNKQQAKALLRELIEWRTRTGAKMGFLTEASANLADDAELCDLMVRAGFKKVFVGFETPSLESLQECRKLQNCRRDLVETVKTLQRAGLEVMGGFIVGFDNDPADIFQRQFEFIQRSGVVTAMVGLLTALPETRLYRRLMHEGRLETESTGNNTEAALNFRPRLGREFLVNGYRELMKELYQPRNYYRRIRTFLENHKPQGPRLRLLAGGLPGLSEIPVAARGLAPRAPRLLAILHHHVAHDGLACSTWPSNWRSSVITSAAWRVCCERVTQGVERETMKPREDQGAVQKTRDKRNRSRGTVPIFAAARRLRMAKAVFAAKMGLSPSAEIWTSLRMARERLLTS